MRLIVAGGRTYSDWFRVKTDLDRLHWTRADNVRISEIVCGMCSEGIITYKEELPDGKAIRVYGADGLGYRWAKENNIPIIEFPAEWGKFKRAAGPLRNAKMADYAEALMVFPGLAGTNDMVRKAESQHLIIFDRRFK